MTTDLPAYLSGPILVLMLTVVTVRYLLFNNSQFERLLNNTLALMVLLNLFRERSIENLLNRHNILSVTTSQQLSMALIIIASGEFIGFVALWSLDSNESQRYRNRRYRFAAVILAIAFLIAGTPARHAGETMEDFGGWSSVAAWALLDFTLPGVMALRLIQMARHEFRRPDARPRERLLAAGGLAIGIAIAGSCIQAVALAVLDQLGWLESSAFRTAFHGRFVFALAVGIAILAAVPELIALIARGGFDDTSRNWRRLQPLLSSMIQAVPEISLQPQLAIDRRRKTILDLHQTLVQLRDALLQLRPWLPDIDLMRAATHFEYHAIPVDQHSDALAALRLAYAAQDKISGRAPDSIDSATPSQSPSADLDHETAEMLRLARWWPQAQQTALHSQSRLS